ncbi:MAG: tetratricopeptide repeat protein [Gammaproteobacteria bacterium]|nr:tetratricopeptide repeat protein [Gammaproteobacteria bacterium]NIR85517.1 tetratricopeptide repeat protein [Gammaproteobacteria bacterium]NIR89776.1 tetratricopeptide repeat protein [Gammaproteobacteria bacterium]NIU06652.1 tetratricopeptide repeat protein [Gammaproteobacteria bacterium]NIV75043.1 tetratricopeptide repeat protein [Gammaproteobacteria bacterium]
MKRAAMSSRRQKASAGGSTRRRGPFAPVASALIVLVCLNGTPGWPQSSAPGKATPAEQAHELWREGASLHLEGRYEAAVARFRRAIKLHPTAEAHTYLGWSLSRLGRYEDAITECRRAIELDPQYGNPYNDIGAYLIELGRPDEAVPWLHRALEAERYCCYHFAHFNLGRAFLLKGHVAAARRAFVRALLRNPNYRPALRALELLERGGIGGA